MTGQSLNLGPGKSRRRERRRLLAGRELLENRAERSITAERCLLRREENKAIGLSRAISVYMKKTFRLPFKKTGNASSHWTIAQVLRAKTKLGEGR